MPRRTSFHAGREGPKQAAHWRGEIEPYVDEAAATGTSAWTVELRVAADEKEYMGCVPCSA